MRNEPLGRQFRSTLIPSRHSRSSDVDLPSHSHRHRLQPLIQHIQLRSSHRSPDRYYTLLALLSTFPHRRTHRRLGRSIRVPHSATFSSPSPHYFAAALLSTSPTAHLLLPPSPSILLAAMSLH